VHALAAEMLELQATGRTIEATARLDELRNLRDELLDHLQRLIQSKTTRSAERH
jgi:hypothetical protein